MFLSNNQYPFLDPSKSSSLTAFKITHFIQFMQSLKAIQSSWFVFLFAYSKFMLMVFLKVLTFSYCITYCTTLIYVIIFPRFQASTTKKPYVGRRCNYNYYIETIATTSWQFWKEMQLF
jgi:hypothetical protein